MKPKWGLPQSDGKKHRVMLDEIGSLKRDHNKGWWDGRVMINMTRKIDAKRPVVRASTSYSQLFTLGKSALAFLRYSLQKTLTSIDIKPDTKLLDTDRIFPFIANMLSFANSQYAWVNRVQQYFLDASSSSLNLRPPLFKHLLAQPLNPLPSSFYLLLRLLIKPQHVP